MKTPSQQRKIQIIEDFKKKGEVAILEYLFELEDLIDEKDKKLDEVVKKIKDRDEKELEIVTRMASNLLKDIKGEKGDDYTLTDGDRKIIAEIARDLIDLQEIAKKTVSLVEIPEEKIAEKASKLIRVPEDSKTPLKKDLIVLIESLIPETIPGKDADEESIIKKIEEDLPKLGERIRDGLEILKDEDRLDKSAIKGLDELIEDLKKKIEEVRGSTSRGGGWGGGARTVQVADLSAQCDGITKTFEVPRHTYAISLQSTQFPGIYRPVVDFTTANKVLQLTSEVSAPETGQTLIFLYIK